MQIHHRDTSSSSPAAHYSILRELLLLLLLLLLVCRIHLHLPVAPCCLVNHCSVVCCRFVVLHKATIHKVELPRSHQLPHLVLHAWRLQVPPAREKALTAAAAAAAAPAPAAAV
jgi:hypothetical protein